MLPKPLNPKPEPVTMIFSDFSCRMRQAKAAKRFGLRNGLKLWELAWSRV